MAIGEKLWEGKGKTTVMTIEGLGSDGVEMKATWVAQLKGFGKAKGMDGQVTYTGNLKMKPDGSGISVGNGVFNTMTGEMAVAKGYGYAKMEAGRGKSVALWNFMTMAPKLVWINDMAVICTWDADPQWTEFTMTVWEWKF